MIRYRQNCPIHNVRLRIESRPADEEIPINTMHLYCDECDNTYVEGSNYYEGMLPRKGAFQYRELIRVNKIELEFCYTEQNLFLFNSSTQDFPFPIRKFSPLDVYLINLPVVVKSLAKLSPFLSSIEEELKKDIYWTYDENHI